MPKRSYILLSVAAALAALSSAPTAPAVEAAPTTGSEKPGSIPVEAVQPNVFYPSGDDLLSLVVTTRADGTVVAQHVSHASHHSHHSHHSHYSSR